MSTYKTYAEKLLDPRWQKKKSRMMERDDYTCQLCSDTNTTLNVHHLKYHPSGNPWDVEDEFLITYCYPCHRVVENCKASKCFVVKKVTKSINPNATMLLALATSRDTDFILVFELIDANKDITFLCMMTEDNINKAYKLFTEK